MTRHKIDKQAAVANILTVIRKADADDWAYGVNWYAKAFHEARTLSDEFGLDIEAVCGIIAALSPRTEWTINLRKAREVCATGTTVGLSNAVGKAERIFRGEAPEDVLSGNKVRSFFDNICNPLLSEAVTIDRHALDVVLNIDTNNDEGRRVLAKVGVYGQVADAYREAGRILGLQAHQVQAVTWECWRKIKTYDRSQHAALYQRSGQSPEHG